VRNIKYAETRKGRLTTCEVYNIYMMGLSEYGQVILDARLLPVEVYVFSDPAALRFARALLKESKKPEVQQLLTYDTTFNMGDTYVSSLVMRNTYLQGNPIFPVAFMLHTQKHTKSHRAFWSEMEEKLMLSKYATEIPFAFDREASFSKELKR